MGTAQQDTAAFNQAQGGLGSDHELQGNPSLPVKGQILQHQCAQVERVPLTDPAWMTAPLGLPEPAFLRQGPLAPCMPVGSLADPSRANEGNFGPTTPEQVAQSSAPAS